MTHVKNKVGSFFESPEDPKAYLTDGAGDESASFWAWEETQMFLEKYRDSGMGLYSFDQGAFGHLRKKPTTCMSNLPDMSELHGCRAGRCERHLAVNLDERLNQTAAWSLSGHLGFELQSKPPVGSCGVVRFCTDVKMRNPQHGACLLIW